VAVRLIRKFIKNKNMNLTRSQLLTAQQALGYAVMYAKTEYETAEFALLKLDIDSSIIRQDEAKRIYGSLDGCPFVYCDSTAKCEGKCHYAKDPHEVSTVKCDLCTKEWVAVRPEGLTQLECPNCGNMVHFENV